MRAFLSILAFLCLAQAGPLRAQDLAILTSFPEQFSDEFVQAFADRHPERDIRVLNKNTVAAVDEVLRGNTRRFGIFWASAPEAFAILKRAGAFAPAGICGAGGPASVEPFAISAVGWAKRRDAAVFMPGDWNDLLKPIYRGKVAMARPSRSGTTHMLVEQLLQVRGWDDGWAYLLELAGNLSTLTARSFGVPEGLMDRRFDIGFTIDFLAQSRAEALQFRYGRPVVLAKAQIGILKQVRDPRAACEFVSMILSREGQLALLKPNIGRVPYDPTIRAEFEDQLPEGIIQTLRLPWLNYDAGMSADRYWSVNTLFDLMITEQLTERRDLWRRAHVLEGRVAPERLAHLRRSLTAIPISWDEAQEASRRIAGGVRGTVLVSLGDAEREIVHAWRPRIESALADARAELETLERQAER